MAAAYNRGDGSNREAGAAISHREHPLTSPHFRVDTEQHADTAVTLHCHGDIDLATCPKLEESITSSLALGISTLRLNLADVAFFDSTGVRCLVECRARCRSHGTELVVTPSPAVTRVLELLGVDLAPSPEERAGARVVRLDS
jgi:anti-sigma B factor antagonist